MSEMQPSGLRAEYVTLSVEELEADPHGVFRRHRPVTPIIAHGAGGFMLLRANDVEKFARDPRLRATETEYPKMQNITEGTLFEFFEQGMLTSNDAVHRRRRSPFTRAFAVRLINELRPHIRTAAEDLIDGWKGESEIEFVDRYAASVPARVISRLLGLPPEDIPYFSQLVYSVSRVLSFTFGPDDLPEMEAASVELHRYAGEILQERRREPRSDFLSSCLADADAKGELSSEELIVQIVSLIIGGTDTTRVAMAALVSLLLEHREQWDAICRDPALIPGAVSEALRYEPSVAATARFTLADIELDDGQILPAGEIVLLSTMSAMRDEAVFAQPDVFNIRRTDQRRLHMIFGGGVHRCIGEALAVAELEEGLAALAARIPHLRLAGAPPKVQGHSGIRRIGDMRVSWPS